jgi:hypothetical protein
MHTSSPVGTGTPPRFCDLKNHKVQDVVLGRSEALLEGCLALLEEKPRVQVVCMGLAVSYRALVRASTSRRPALWPTAST